MQDKKQDDVLRNLTEAHANNVSSPVSDSLSSKDLIACCITITISLVTTLLSVAALVTLYKCSKMPYQLKRLSVSGILSDVMFHGMMVITNVVVIVIGEKARQALLIPRAIIASALHLTSIGSVAGLTLDRLIAVKKPLHYASVLTKKKINIIIIYTWLVHSLAFFIPLIIVCDGAVLGCDTRVLHLPNGILLAIFYSVYHPFIICSYVVITKRLRRQVTAMLQHIASSKSTPRATAREQQLYNITVNIVHIVLAFEITNLPLSINTFGFVIFPSLKDENIKLVIHVISYVCICCNSHISLYFYVWKMKECKYIFLSTFFWWSKKLSQTASQLKQEVYGIYSNPVQPAHDNHNPRNSNVRSVAYSTGHY